MRPKQQRICLHPYLPEVMYRLYSLFKPQLTIMDARIIESLQVAEVTRKFEPPRIDLPVKAQMMIYHHEYLKKALFCSLYIVKLFQKVTMAYRGTPVEIG
jgi:hypothetical protein